MREQEKLLDMMKEIRKIAETQQNKLTKGEIKAYLGSKELDDMQMQAIYQYLGENHIQVEGYRYVPQQKEKPEERKTALEKKPGRKAEQKKTGTQSENNMRRYQSEIARISGDLKKEEELIVSFLKGNDEMKERIVEKYLQEVINIAERYRDRGAPADEMIAEGNVGLMLAVNIIQENRSDYFCPDGRLDAKKFFGTLEIEVSHAIERYIDEVTESKDWENAVLAKTNLLHEATKYMTEEMGRVPTIEELSEYTKLSRQEINSIRRLSEDAKRITQER